MKKMIGGYPYVQHHMEKSDEIQMKTEAESFYHKMDKRRTVRDFVPTPICKTIIENIIRTASTAPSGAHMQPWTFCVISNPEIKKQIRIAAEKEEQLSYGSRMPADWLEDLAPLGTNWEKPFLEIAPYLIVVFKKSYAYKEDGTKKPNYYVTESCGIACGFLLAAIHHAGLCALTHTPSPMNFLSSILNRPGNEKPFLLIPVGHIAETCFVPDIERKSLQEISIWFD